MITRGLSLLPQSLIFVSLFGWLSLSTVVAQENPLDRPFPQPMYLVHITETGTTSGPRIRDDYILYPSAPQDGILITPDGMGGTFTNKAEAVAGPFYTLRQVCDYVQNSASVAQTLGCPMPTPQATAQPTVETTTYGPGTTEEEQRRQEGGFREWWGNLDGRLKAAIIIGLVAVVYGLSKKRWEDEQKKIRQPCGQSCQAVSGCINACSKVKRHGGIHDCQSEHRTPCTEPCYYPGCGNTCSQIAPHAGSHSCSRH